MKKEKVNVDIVCFGEATSAEEDSILQEFVDTLNVKDGAGSNLVVVSSGSTLREALASSAICRAEGGGQLVGAAGFDFDGEEDPELALAVRVSLEEQRARQREQEAAAGEGGAAMEVDKQGGESASNAPVAQPLLRVDPAGMTEEEQLELAVRMSMQEMAPGRFCFKFAFNS